MAKLSDNEINIRVVPTLGRWPDRPQIAFSRLREAGEALRALAHHVNNLCAKEEGDADLSPAGRARRNAEVGKTALQELDTFKPGAAAKRAVDANLADLEKTVQVLPAAGQTTADALMAQEIRHFLRTEHKDPLARFNVLNAAISDARMVNAIVNAPAALSGLSDEQVAMIKHRAQTALHPDLCAIRDDLNTAMKALNDGVAQAKRLILERTGLRADKDGQYRMQSEPEPVLSLSRKPGEAA